MKPIDLQVNILKTLDMVAEKGRESIINSQVGHLEDKSKKERQVKDFHVAQNKESEEIKNKLPEHLPEKKNREGESGIKSKTGEAGSLAEDKKDREEIDLDEHIGRNVDIRG